MLYYDDDELQKAKKRRLATHPNAPRSAKKQKGGKYVGNKMYYS